MKAVAFKEVIYAGKLELQLGCSVNYLYFHSSHSLLFQHNVTDFSFSLLIKLNNHRESHLITDNGFLAASCEALAHIHCHRINYRGSMYPVKCCKCYFMLLHGLLMEDLVCPCHSLLEYTQPLEVSCAQLNQRNLQSIIKNILILSLFHCCY